MSNFTKINNLKTENMYRYVYMWNCILEKKQKYTQQENK